MRKRVLSWGLAIAMAAGSLVPSVPAYAAEEVSEPVVAVAETVMEEGPATDETSEDAAKDAATAENTAGENTTAENTADESTTDENITENGADNQEDVNNETSEDVTENESDTAKDEVTTTSVSAEESPVTTTNFTLTLRSLDLMYGESDDNTDGHLDNLFAPVVTDAETGHTYELKTADSKEDALTFTTSYKFIEDRSAFDTESEQFTALTDADKADTFKSLVTTDLAKTNAGTKLYIAAMAVTSDGAAVFATTSTTIIKRPVAISFPATEDLSVSAQDNYEDGLLTVPVGSDLFSDITVVPVTEYTVEANTATVEGTPSDKLTTIPAATDFIVGDVTLDLSALDLLTEGYQPAAASFELNEELLTNFTVAEDYQWPVYVTVDPEYLKEQAALLGASQTTASRTAENGSGALVTTPKENALGFTYNSTTGLQIEIETNLSGTPVDIFASQNAKRTGAVKLGTANLSSKSLKLDINTLAPGTYYIFGRFYTDDSKKKYTDTKGNIVLKNIPGPGPEIVDITHASTIGKPDGAVKFKLNGTSTELLCGVYGADTLTYQTSSTTDSQSSYRTVTGLKPGHYAAFVKGYQACKFADTFEIDSQTIDFFIDIREAQLNDLELTTAHDGYRLQYTSNNGKSTSSDIPVLNIKKGDTVRIVGKLVYSGAVDAPKSSNALIFESSNPKEVSVDAVGNIKALKSGGSATITVTTVALKPDGNPIEKEFLVNVTEPALKSLKTAKFDKATINLQQVTGPLDLTLTLDKGAVCDITWTSDNLNVATLDANSKKGIYEYKVKADGSGKATLPVYLKAPGQAVISATIGGLKTITCTINNNGTTGEGESYFYNGKYLSGFWGFDNNDVPVASGASAIRNKKVSYVRYYDPMTFKPVKNTIVTVGKKLYHIGADYKLTVGDFNKSQMYGYDGEVRSEYVINSAGEVLTGWQTAANSFEGYYSPLDGKRAKSSWVSRGKGVTWVNADGRTLDADGTSLSVDGLHTIIVDGAKQTYCFKGGLRVTGVVYFDSSYKITTVNKASFARFFDPGNGAMSKGAPVAANGKRYFTDPKTGDILKNKEFAFKESSQITDGTGAIIFGPRIYKKPDGNYCYIDGDGMILRSSYITFGGKLYYCDANGIVGTGSAVQQSGYTYPDGNLDSPSDVTFKPVYTKQANAKNATAGLAFYSDAECTKKLTNQFLCDNTSDHLPVYYLDKNGNPARGIQRIHGFLFFFDPDTAKISATRQDHIIQYKGKYYACNGAGSIYTDTTKFYYIDYNYVRVKDSSGVLMTGVQKIDGKRYCFLPDGELVIPESGLIQGWLQSEIYFANPEAPLHPSRVNDDPSLWYIAEPGKTIIYTNDTGNSYIIKPNGSVVFSGWNTVNGKKYYVNNGKLAGPGDGILKISGKYYTFGPDHTMLTGWQKIPGKEYIFYFNDKTGAMETGWKTMNTLKTEGGKIVQTGFPVSSGTKKKIYFNTAATSELPVGALITNMDLTVGGKLYRFDADGSVKSGQESLVQTDPISSGSRRTDSYLKNDGTMARGRTLVKTPSGSGYFYFGLADGTKETDVIRKTGNKWYYYDKNGQQSTCLTLYLDYQGGFMPATAVFNSDGSIKSFTRQDGKNTVLKNCVLKADTGSNKYYIGSNGLPMTGLVNDPTNGYKILVEADGTNAGTYLDNSEDYSLIKSGNKYYMLRDGVVFTSVLASPQQLSGSVIRMSATKDMFSKLSAADQAEIDKAFKFAEAGYGSSADPIICLNADGTVHVGSVNIDGLKCTTNKFGIVKDSISLFVNNGGWKISAFNARAWDNKPKILYATEVAKLTGLTGSDPRCALYMSWDQNGNVTFVDAKSGKPVSGDYVVMEDAEPQFCFKLKNGKLAPGVMKETYRGVTISLNCEKDYGYAIPSN